MIEDLKICFATVKILFMSESTEGVAEDQVTAMREEKQICTEKSAYEEKKTRKQKTGKQETRKQETGMQETAKQKTGNRRGL